ncbi:MAG: hypothetical protein R2867_07545 [Caldilineaceae bacterium]
MPTFYMEQSVIDWRGDLKRILQMIAMSTSLTAKSGCSAILPSQVSPSNWWPKGYQPAILCWAFIRHTGGHLPSLLYSNGLITQTVMPLTDKSDF